MTRRLTLGKFIEKANIIHGNLYNYSLSEYVNGRKKITIICNKHGKFYPSAENHLNKKSGCPECAGLTRSTTEKFIKKSNVIHNNKFDYTLVSYTNNHTKVSIVCPVHGIFYQSPNTHLAGNGCRKCTANTSIAETEWLNALHVPISDRQYTILVGTKKYIVDGFDSSNNTVYEFLGDYWHGNPLVYDAQIINSRKGVTFGELYDATCKKLDNLRKAGYIVVEMWESEFNKGNR